MKLWHLVNNWNEIKQKIQEKYIFQSCRIKLLEHQNKCFNNFKPILDKETNILANNLRQGNKYVVYFNIKMCH